MNKKVYIYASNEPDVPFNCSQIIY